ALGGARLAQSAEGAVRSVVGVSCLIGRIRGGRRSIAAGTVLSDRRIGRNRVVDRVLQPLLGLSVLFEVACLECGVRVFHGLPRFLQSIVERLVRRSGTGALTVAGGGTAGLAFLAVLSAGVAGLGTGVAAEHLVERLVEGRGEADVLSEGHE